MHSKIGVKRVLALLAFLCGSLFVSAEQMPPASGMLNVSVRGEVVGGETVLIAGFVVKGEHTHTCLIRGIGPSLETFGLTGVLKAPTLKIYDQTGKEYEDLFVYTQMVGALGPQEHLQGVTKAVGAFPLQAGAKDAAELRPIRPGAYTVILRGAPGDKGTAMIEVYDAGPLQ